jgi:hypothetical protein
MRVRCRATPDPGSNALGRIELETAPEGLWISYVSVRRYREGYAPGPAAAPSEHRVPWRAVRATRVGAESLRLEVEEPLSPFAHFHLRDFTRAEPARWIARGRPWDRLSSPQVVLTEFCHALADELGGPVASQMALPAQPELGAASAIRRLPRSGVACAIVLASAGLAALMLEKSARVPAQRGVANAESWPGALATAAPPPEQLVVGLAPPSPPAQLLHEPEPAEPPSLPPPTLGGGCECIRHESILWQVPPPRLSVLVTRQQPRTHASHQHLELELALVNDSDRELANLTLGVRFQIARPGPPGSNDVPVERSLYLPGPLAPGHQLRWQVEGRGDRFALHIPDLGRLDEDGLDAAPADEFVNLAGGARSFVSLHAAMMLAFLGDARAPEILRRLRPGLSASELSYVDRLLDGAADVRVCQLRISAAGRATTVQSCLYNAADRPRADFQLKLRSLRPTPQPLDPSGAPPQVLAEDTLAWSGTLAAHRGRRLTLTSNLGGTEPANRWIELLVHPQESPQ